MATRNHPIKNTPRYTGKSQQSAAINYTLDCEREDDGRWLAEVLELPGVLAYGTSQDEAMARAEVLALRTLAERLEHGEARATAIHISIPAAV